MRPLEGIRVLDLSRLIPGPFATLLLADMGAVVDKVEDPGAGDYLRHLPPQIAGASGAFQALNRGKRSLVLDLKAPAGREALLAMLGGYDVLLEQFRPGVLERLGLGHAFLRERFPGLVICALSGYGQTGPLAHRAGHDLNYLARAGLLGFHGPKEGPPQVPGFQVADVGGALYAALAIVGALRVRDKTGQGEVLDIALADAPIGFAAAAYGAVFAGEMPARGEEALSGGLAIYATYETADGGYVSFGALEPKFYQVFASAHGLPFDMSAFLVGAHQTALRAQIAAVFRSKTRAEWERFAETHDCCVEPVLRPDELRADAHLAARETFFEIDVDGQPVGQFRTPVTPRDVSFAPPPRAGEHTLAILREGGLDEATIASLVASGVAVAKAPSREG
jgi:crotonobetainyl-CoA:carnitine CoA-transferase CaiB-like acyl-CoA transferase